MFAAIASVVLSLVSPLIGQTFDSHVDRRARPTSAPTVVDPRTLQPVEDAPRLPGATSVDVAPAGDRIVGVRRDLLVFASLRSGRELGRMPIDLRQQPVVSWIARDRLLVIDCALTRGPPFPPFCDETYVRVIDPIEREVVGDTLAFPAGFETARVGSRQLVLLNPRAETPGAGPPGFADDGRFPSVLVLDAQGRPEHVVELRELSAVGSLDGSLVFGYARDPYRRLVYRIDAARGRVAAERIVEHPVDGWLLPSPRGSAVLKSSTRSFLHAIDRAQLAPRDTFEWNGQEPAMASGSGYLARKFSARRRGHDTLLSFDIDGTQEWSREIPEFAYFRAIGRYVYVQHRDYSTEPRPPRFWIDVYRLRDGARVAHRRGRFDLYPPSGGRSYAQVPGLVSSREFRADEN